MMSQGMSRVTYAEDNQAADNGGVLRVGGLVVDGAEKALLAGGNTLRGHFVGR